MHINIISILVICVIAGLCYWVNQTLNTTPILNKVVSVIIVVVAVLLVLQSMGLVGTNTTVTLN